jgi:hypothetical protein
MRRVEEAAVPKLLICSACVKSESNDQPDRKQPLLSLYFGTIAKGS